MGSTVFVHAEGFNAEAQS